MATIVDSYTGFHASLSVDNKYKVSQSFTGDGGILDSAVVGIFNDGFTSGTITAKIYAESHATAFGTDSIPTGSVLATSDNINASEIVSGEVTFTFSGSNKIKLSNGIKYELVIDFTSIGSSDYGGMAIDTTEPTHNGNLATYVPEDWFPDDTEDLYFKVYRDDELPPSTILQDPIGGIIPFPR